MTTQTKEEILQNVLDNNPMADYLNESICLEAMDIWADIKVDEVKHLIDEAKKDNPTLDKIHGLMDLAYQDGVKDTDIKCKQIAIGFLLDTTGDMFKHNAEKLFEAYINPKK